MTTFVLHGGETSKDSLDNDSFFRQFTGLCPSDTVSILMCYWAREKNRWETLIKRDESSIRQHTHKQVSFLIAEDEKDLISKLGMCDVLYVTGGDAEFIEPYLPMLANLKQHLDGKIYIGSSMGVFVASQHYILSFDSQDDKNVHSGLGLIPFNTLCHWDIESHKRDKLENLKKADPQMPILTLDECKFVTIYV